MYKVKHGTKETSRAEYKGYTIYWREVGGVLGWTVPGIDRESVFDDKREARRFIDAMTKRTNPSFRKSMKEAKKREAASRAKWGTDYGGIASESIRSTKTAVRVAKRLKKAGQRIKARGDEYGDLGSIFNPKRRNGRSYARKGVPMGVPRYNFDPRKGDVFYLSGKKATVKRRYDDGGTDYVDFTRPVDGTTGMSVGNLYQASYVPETSRFAGYRGKSNPKRPTTVPATIVMENGKARVFVSPAVMRKMNPHPNPAYRIVPITKERYEQYIRPLLRSPYNLQPFSLFKRTQGRGQSMLFHGDQFIKGGTKAFLKKYAKREAGL